LVQRFGVDLFQRFGLEGGSPEVDKLLHQANKITCSPVHLLHVNLKGPLAAWHMGQVPGYTSWSCHW